MSIDQKKVIDSINTNKDSTEVLLTLTDHLDWDSSINEHIFKLQEKIKSYLDFIEEGELVELYPALKGKPITINVISKYPLPENETVKDFFSYASNMVTDSGFKFKFSVFQTSE